MHYAVFVIPLLVVGLLPVAFAQVETMTFPNGTTVEVETFPEPISFPVPLQSDEIYEEGENVTIYYTDRDGIGVAQIHYPYFLTEQGNYIPYRLTQNDSMAQVEFNDGKMVFDKNAGAVTLFKNGNQVVDSDSYLVRTAQLNSDEWTFLDVNDSPIETIIEEEGDKVTITFRQQNNEGIFDVEHVFQGEIKTTAKFTNFIYPDHKFAFTQTLNLSDNIITLNDQEINLDDFVGQTFPREVLEQNEDLVLLAKDLHYNSGIGFDNLWSVGIFENNKIALDYANVEQTQTAIGETVELDPTYQAPTSGWVVGGFICNSSQYSRFNEATDNANYLTGNNNMYQGIHCGCSGSSPSSCGTIHKAVRFDLGATYDIAYIDTHHSGYGWWYGYHPTLTGSINGNTFLSHTGSVAYNAANTQVLHHSSTVNTQARYIDYTLGGYSAYKTLVEVRPFLNLATVSTAPQSLTTSQSTANEIILNWSAPSSDGGASITNYKIYLGGTLIDTIGNVLTYTDTISGSEIGSGLTYHVIAVNSVGDSPSSNNSVITSWDVPDQVTGLTAQDGYPIILNWNIPASDDTITNYEIKRDGSVIATVGAVTTYSDSPPTTGTSHSFEISAISAVGQGAYSSSVNGLSGLPADAPSLALAHDSNNLNIEVTITNGASMGTGTFTQWNIERSADGSTNWTVVGTPTTSPFTDTVPSSGTWYYRATTQSDHGTSAYSSIVNIAHVDPDLPSITASYYDPNSSDIQVVITNGASFGTGTFTSYTVERSTDGSTNWTNAGNPTASPFIDTTAPSVGDWYYRATTTTAHGTSAYSSNALASPVAPDVPTNLTSVISNPDPSPLTISLDWDSPINFGSGTLTGYEVYRDGSLITTTGTASQYDDTVTVQGTYVYTIKTVTNHAVSSLSGSTTISTPTQPSADSSVTLSIDNPNPSPLDITVSLVAPSSNGGSAVTGYNIFSSPDDITYTLVSSNVNTAQTITVANSGTWYFKSQAINNVGTAAVGSAVSIVTPTVPSTPSLTLSIIDPNASPFDITSSFVAPTSDGGSAVTGYNLYYSSDNITYSSIASAVTADQLKVVSGIGTHYFKAEAINNVGTGSLSAVFSIATPVLPTAVSDLAVSSVTDTTVGLTWTEPANGGSNIIDYTIYRDGNSIGTTTTVGYADSGLTTQTSYIYTVYARSNAGTSLVSNSVTQVTEGVPAVVPSFQATSASLEAITLSWTEPNDYGAAITGYLIERESPTGNGFATVTTTGVVTAYSDTGLTPVTEYNYRISAINSYGNGATTTSSTTTLPAPPTNIMVTPSSSTSELVVSWTAPADTTGMTGYQIYRENGIGNGFTLINTSTNLGTTFTDTGLTTNVFYNYKLKSVSPQGNSAYSNTYAQTTFNLPDPVTVLTATTGTVADVTLDWDAPANPYGAIIGYTIYKVDAPGTTATATATLSTTLDQVSSITITDGGLQYSVAPTVTVSAPTGQLPHVTATATAAITNGVVTSITVTNNGDGYNTIPTVTLTSPSINTSVSPTTTLTPFIVDTGDTTTSRTITGLEPAGTHNFAIAPITIHGSSILNAAIVSTSPNVSFEGIVIDMPDDINPNQNPIKFMKTQVGNNTNLTLEYDAALDVTCETTNPFSATTNTYPNLSETSLGNGKVTHTITFNDSQNNIVDVMCYDVNDPTIKGQSRIQQNIIPLKEQMDDFQANTFGTGSSFAAIDLMTLIVVIVGMIGFNRKNPAVGLALMAGLIGILTYFQVIELETSVIGGFTLVVFLAIAMGLKRS